jgi:hypothetical protein
MKRKIDHTIANSKPQHTIKKTQININSRAGKYNIFVTPARMNGNSKSFCLIVYVSVTLSFNIIICINFPYVGWELYLARQS